MTNATAGLSPKSAFVLYHGRISKVARELNVNAATVRKVDKGSCRSKRITEALHREDWRIRAILTDQPSLGPITQVGIKSAVAAKLGVSRQFVSQVMNGKAKSPNVRNAVDEEIALRIARAQQTQRFSSDDDIVLWNLFSAPRKWDLKKAAKLARVVRGHRTKLKLTPEAFANRVGVQEADVLAWECAEGFPGPLHLQWIGLRTDAENYRFWLELAGPAYVMALDYLGLRQSVSPEQAAIICERLARQWRDAAEAMRPQLTEEERRCIEIGRAVEQSRLVEAKLRELKVEVRAA